MAGREWPAARILGTIAGAVLNERADSRMATTESAAESRRRPVAGVGRVMAWPGGSLWIGRHFGAIQDHAHHAIQLSLTLEGAFRVQAAGWSDWPANSANVARNSAISSSWAAPSCRMRCR